MTPVLSHALQSEIISAKDALRTAVLMLQRARIESASLDARLLLEYVLGVTREELLADASLVLSPEQDVHYQDLITRRMRRQPVAQLVGRREFWGMDFAVTGDTLDPRADSETLIQALLEKLRDRSAAIRILDLGTGTGCLLLSLLKEFPAAKGVGVDICTKALDVARANAAKNELQDRASFTQSCWSEKVEGKFDIVISNPPYIPTATIATLAPEVSEFEPKGALDGGVDGFDCYREIIAALPQLLSEEGIAALEMGIGQQREMENIVAQHGLKTVGVKDDLAGIPRCILIKHSSNN